MICYDILVGGWPTPLKNMSMSSSVGMMTFPTEWTNKTWSKPPSSGFLHQRSKLSVVWQFDLPSILRIVRIGGNRNANVLFFLGWNWWAKKTPLQKSQHGQMTTVQHSGTLGCKRNSCPACHNCLNCWCCLGGTRLCRKNSKSWRATPFWDKAMFMINHRWIMLKPQFRHA